MRYIPDIQEEFYTIRMSQEAWFGIVQERKSDGSYKRNLSLVIPLIFSSLRGLIRFQRLWNCGVLEK